MRKEYVYITNLGGHNFNPAREYGDLIPLTKGNINPIQADRILVEMMDILKDSIASDYLVLSGHPVTVAIAVSILMQLHGKVNLLIWNKYKRRYNVREITAEQINELYKFAVEG